MSEINSSISPVHCDQPYQITPEFHIQVLQCTKALVRELAYVFPSVDVKSIIAVPTLQHSRCDLVSYGGEIEVEKDRLLNEFMRFSRHLCDNLKTAGYWADYIDPCSGLPMISESAGKTFNEVDCMQSLFQFQVMNAGCCKILLHPLWGSAVYPASIFSNAPKEVINTAIVTCSAAFNMPSIEQNSLS